MTEMDIVPKKKRTIPMRRRTSVEKYDFTVRSPPPGSPPRRRAR